MKGVRIATAAAKRQLRRTAPPAPVGSDTAPPVTSSRPELMGDGTGERFRQLVNDLFTIAVRMDAVRARFSAMIGVSPPQYAILMTVAQLEGGSGGATVVAVAEHAHVSGAFVTAESGKLAGLGLLAKRPNPADGRSVLLSLTAKGRAAIEAALPNIRAVNDAFFGKLGAEDFGRLSVIAARIVDASAGAVLLAHALSAGAEKK